MTFAATIYVDASGTIWGASETDQRHTKATERTRLGRPVELAGTWYGSQMSYRPFRRAVEAAAKRAAERTVANA